MDATLSSLAVFVFGVIMGSFLNVLVLRWGTGLGLGKRSFCFSCSKQLSWYELIPVFSFLVQGGRCRSCKSAISAMYLLVEIATGLLFFFLFLKMGLGFWWIYIAGMLFLLLAIALYDAYHKIIPDPFVYFFVALSFGLLFFRFLSGDALSWEFFAGPALALPFVFLWFVSSGRWMGLGDAKLALGIGWALGFSEGIAALLLAFWSGALWGVMLLAYPYLFHLFTQKKGRTIKSEIPFAPFLVLGTFLAFYFDITLLDIQAFFTFSPPTLF
ncbi:MAG TPA: prepilin peptidase [Candidatus Paceibacterota bacterium]